MFWSVLQLSEGEKLAKPGFNVIKLFTAVMYDVCIKRECLSPTGLFQPTAMFSSKARPYLSKAPFRSSNLAKAPGLYSQIFVIGWKNLRLTKTLAYYEHL